MEWEEIFASHMSDKGLLILLYIFKLYKGSKKPNNFPEKIYN